MSVTVDQLVAVARRELLVSGGVDNWDWYSESLNEHGYVPSDDIYVDAENWFDALDLGGIDGWDWLGDSLDGLDEYEEHLATLDTLDGAPSIRVWLEMVAAEKAAAVAAKAAEPVAPPVVKKRVPDNASEQRLYDIITERFGADRADDIFERMIAAGIWKYSTFQKEYQKAMKVIVKDMDDPLEHARAALIDILIKGKKLLPFLDDIAAG